MLMRNLTAKWTLRTTPRLHRRVTRNNTLGILPVPNVITPMPTLTATAPRRMQPIAPTRIGPRREARAAHSAIPGGAQQRIVTQHAINILTLREQASFSTIHTPRALMKHAKMRVNMEHYANPMVHPVTGCTISSYKQLRKNLPKTPPHGICIFMCRYREMYYWFTATSFLLFKYSPIIAVNLH
jgi:hypothetical protein